MTGALNYAHQEELFDPKVARKIIVIGAGSVGSWLVEFLVRMGVHNVEVWDADSVSSYNIPMSRYRPVDVGRYKVDALAEIISELGVSIVTHREMYEGQADFRNASVISCVDTMESRHIIWEQVKRQRVSVDLFCDTRLARAYVEIFSIAPCDQKDVKRYDAMLFPDEHAVKQMCGSHGIVFASTRAAGVVAATLAQFWQTGHKEWLVQERCDTMLRVM